MVKAFSGWVEKGFQAMSAQKPPPMQLCSWRFWAKGTTRDAIVCGLCRDSSDSVGRPYPLLIVGTGSFSGWADAWDLLPRACEKTWSHMEYLSAKRFVDFRQLEDEVRHLKPPERDWSVLRAESLGEARSGSNPYGDASFALTEAVKRRLAALSQEIDFVVPLNEGPADDSYKQACVWHAELKALRKDIIPNAVFMGGTSKGTYLAVFRRALTPADFVRLWLGDGRLKP